jgi:hypothetical protein
MRRRTDVQAPAPPRNWLSNREGWTFGHRPLRTLGRSGSGSAMGIIADGDGIKQLDGNFLQSAVRPDEQDRRGGVSPIRRAVPQTGNLRDGDFVGLGGIEFASRRPLRREVTNVGQTLKTNRQRRRSAFDERGCDGRMHQCVRFFIAAYYQSDMADARLGNHTEFRLPHSRAFMHIFQCSFGLQASSPGIPSNARRSRFPLAVAARHCVYVF